MRELFDRARGFRLGPDAYVADFDRRFWDIGAEGFWKLERRQTFREPGVRSWELLRDGDWAGSLRLVESQRPEFERHLGRMRAAGFGHHRVRVVEQPVSPYLQWELNVLQIKDECGEDVRVVRAEDVAALESDGPLPELVVLGTDAAYQVLVTADGRPDGALRQTDRAVVDAARSLVQRLHRDGEPLGPFLAREITPLDPPPPGAC